MKREKMYIFILFISSLFIAVGYATVNNSTLSLAGIGTVADNGTVKIKSITKLSNESTSNVTVSEVTKTDTTFAFTASFTIGENDTSSTEHYVTYEIVVENDSIYEYVIGSEVFNPKITKTAPQNGVLDHAFAVLDITERESIPAKSEKTFRIKLSMFSNGIQGNYIAGVNAEVKAEESTEGNVAGKINGSNTGDLRGTNTIAKFTATVMNSYQRVKEFTFSINNQNFSIVDSNGNQLSNYIIGGNEAGLDYDFYIKRNDNVTFPQESISFNVYLNPTDEEKTSIGIVTLLLDKDDSLNDYVAPQIDDISVTKGNIDRILNVSWSGTDNIGISYYNIFLLNASGDVIKEEKNLLSTEYTFTDVSDDTYSVKVEAYDGSNNSSSKITSNTEYTWTYNYTVSCSHCSASPESGNVEAGSSISITFSGETDYDPPSTMTTVTMYDSTTGDSKDLNSSEYTYADYNLTINNITGNIMISAEGRSTSNWTPCLIEGTKVLMANGKYKKIEDVYYDDLIMVYNHETGDFIPEYPIWIENGKKTKYYQLNTFSDGTTLKTLGSHTVFSTDANEFVNVIDKDKYHIGTRILKVEKINNNYKFKEVTVTNIEIIYEEVNYYDVVSTRYYNAITDDVLTSDGRPELSNFYLFKENALWSDRRQEVLEKNIQIPYEQVSYMPYYLYKGLRAMDGEVLVHYGYMSYVDFQQLFENLLMNPYMQLPPKTNANGNRVWMVTTNFDNVNENNKNKYLLEEGSYYTLPKCENVSSWYSTSDNKYYIPGDIVQIWHGMHFIAY